MNGKSLPAPLRQDDEPAPSRPLAGISDRLTRGLDDEDEASFDRCAAPDGPRAAGGRRVRVDGWTPERITIFLHALAECGVVRDAARAAGMSRSSAYAFRTRPEGRGFADGWESAELIGRRRLADELMSRALHGCVEKLVRDGKVIAERHRYCATTSLSVLRRLDQKMLARDSENATARLGAQEFAEFVELIAAGGDGLQAFLISRSDAEGVAAPKREAGLLARLAAYSRRLLAGR
jgi:hypothetical protein